MIYLKIFKKRWAILSALLALHLSPHLSANDQTIASKLQELPPLQSNNLEKSVENQIKSQALKIKGELQNYQTMSSSLAEQYELMGQLYHAYELYELAKISYGNALIIAPNRFESQYLLALSYLDSEQPEEAVEHFVKAQKINPKYAALWINLGNTLERLAQYDKSKLAFQKAQALQPNDPSIYAGAGKVYLSEKQYDKSIQFYENALKLIPEANRLHYSLALAYRGAGNESKAREHLKLSGKIGVKPIDPIRENLEQLQAGERVQLLQGKTAYSLGKYQVAADKFKEALEANSDSVSARINLAAALTKLNKTAEAQSHLEAAIKLAPKNVTAHYNLAQLLEYNKKYSAALGAYETAKKLAPNDTQIIFKLANLQKNIGQLQSALSNYEFVSQRSPSNTVAQVEYANLLFHNKEYAKSIDVLEKAHSLFPTDGLISHDLARALVTVPEKKLRNGEKAINLAKVVMNAQPTLKHADTLVRAFVEIGDCKNASAMISQIISGVSDSDPKLAKLQANYKELLDEANNKSQCKN